MSAGEIMPTTGVIANPWRLMPLQTARRSRAGSEQVVTLGRSIWMFDAETTTLAADDFRFWLAWLDRRQGSKVTFTATCVGQTRPNGVPANDDAVISVEDIGIAQSTIRLGNVGASTVLAGDLISYYTAAGGYWAGRATADASASQGAITIYVAPPPLPPHASTVSVRRTSAIAEFALSAEPRIEHMPGGSGRVSFSAAQVIRG